MSYILVCGLCERYTGHSLREDGFLVCQICGQPGEQREDILALGDEITTWQALEMPMKVKDGEAMCAAALNEVREQLVEGLLVTIEHLQERVAALERRVTSHYSRFNDLISRINK